MIDVFAFGGLANEGVRFTALVLVCAGILFVLDGTERLDFFGRKTGRYRPLREGEGKELVVVGVLLMLSPLALLAGLPFWIALIGSLATITCLRFR